jgi:hypothetical protein
LVALPACEIHSITAGTGGGSTTSAAAGTTASGSTSGTSGATAGTGGATAGTGGATASSSSGAGGGTACAPEASHVYAIATDKKLFRLDHVSGSPWATTLVGTIACATAAEPYSIAIDRSAQAWVVYTDGKLFKVDTSTAACTATAFVAGQHGFTTFSMAFAADAPGSDLETLYVSGSGDGGSPTGLATIDRSTLTLAPVGDYDIPTMGPPVTPPVQLAGGADGKLSGGFFINNAYYYGQFDPTSAHAIETNGDPTLLIHSLPADTHYAIIPWGKDFEIFTTTAGGMKTYTYNHDGAVISSFDGAAGVTAVSLLTLSASTCATVNQTP